MAIQVDGIRDVQARHPRRQARQGAEHELRRCTAGGMMVSSRACEAMSGRVHGGCAGMPDAGRSMAMGRPMGPGPIGRAGHGSPRRATGRSMREQEEKAARSLSGHTIHDPYYNIVEVTVYGQARFYNPAAPRARPEPSAAEPPPRRQGTPRRPKARPRGRPRRSAQGRGRRGGGRPRPRRAAQGRAPKAEATAEGRGTEGGRTRDPKRRSAARPSRRDSPQGRPRRSDVVGEFRCPEGRVMTWAAAGSPYPVAPCSERSCHHGQCFG